MLSGGGVPDIESGLAMTIVPKELVTKLGQPLVHQRNKGVLETLCSCCCSERCDLMKSEVDYYFRFRQDMIVSYDESNPTHEVGAPLSD